MQGAKKKQNLPLVISAEKLIDGGDFSKIFKKWFYIFVKYKEVHFVPQLEFYVFLKKFLAISLMTRTSAIKFFQNRDKHE